MIALVQQDGWAVQREFFIISRRPDTVVSGGQCCPLYCLERQLCQIATQDYSISTALQTCKLDTTSL
jgi:hypothetical protein